MTNFIWAVVFLSLCGLALIAPYAVADEPAHEPNAGDTEQFKAADATNKAFAIPELEERILAARRAIKTAEMEIESDYTDQRGQRVTPNHFWIGTEDRARWERQNPNEQFVLIYGDLYAFQYFRRPGQMENLDQSKRPGINAMTREDLKAEPPEKSNPLFSLTDPRRLMFAPVQFGLLHAHKLDDLIGANDRTQFESHDSTWNGESSRIVSFYRPRTDNYFEYEVVPSRGFNIVRWHLWGKSKDGQSYDENLTCELQRVVDSTWFPKSVNLQGLRDGKVLHTEKLSIKIVSINQPIDDKVFSLAGLPPRLVVAFDMFRPAPRKPRRPAMIWDGEKVRAFKSSDLHYEEELMKKIE